MYFNISLYGDNSILTQFKYIIVDFNKKAIGKKAIINYTNNKIECISYEYDDNEMNDKNLIWDEAVLCYFINDYTCKIIFPELNNNFLEKYNIVLFLKKNVDKPEIKRTFVYFK